MTQPVTILKQIHASEPRSKVRVQFPDGEVLEGPLGLPLEAFVQRAEGAAARNVLAAQTDDHIADLNEPIVSDVSLQLVPVSSDAGFRIYQRSMIFALDVAVRELFPQARIEVDHALSFGGLYCRALKRPPFSAEELSSIQNHLKEIAAADEPITCEQLSFAQAVEYFRSFDEPYKVDLLEQAHRPEIQLHRLRGVKKFFFDEILVPSTGYLKEVALIPYRAGFALQFPVAGRYSPQVPPVSKLTDVFAEYGAWLDLLGVRDVTTLNRAIGESRSREISLVSEALHAQRIAEIAARIARERDRLKVVLIAGPSSSGKTTFTRRLAVQLLANGIRPYPLSLDDYFRARADTPRDASGNPDFESLRALDLDRFNADLAKLIRGETCTLPKYNFITGEPEVGPTICLTPDHVLLLEGIHGLNPELLPTIPPENLFRIYASALTQLKLDRLNRISTTDTRLIRRLVRDAATRGYTARQTISRWISVVRGEEKHIFPFQENADVLFNSALVYELAALKPLAEPLLRRVEPGTPEYVEARRLLTFLQWFQSFSAEMIPEDSILREFVGGSLFADDKYPLKLF